MKERPILFSAPMVRALLDGSKTQTRRVLRPQPASDGAALVMQPGEPLRCPFGVPGDRLWVREAHALENRYRNVWCRYRADDAHSVVPAPAFVDIALAGWRPSIHMPRWASRISLEVVSVRVERLQAISEADVIAEGCPREILYGTGWYRDLWNAINGAGAWDANPWVWAVEFRRLP